jgi:hypothetical protein
VEEGGGREEGREGEGRGRGGMETNSCNLANLHRLWIVSRVLPLRHVHQEGGCYNVLRV